MKTWRIDYPFVGDERYRRPEMAPTRAMLLTDSIVQKLWAAATGAGLVLAFVFLAVFALPERYYSGADDLLSLLGGPLVASFTGIALFSLASGFALTSRRLALADMFARSSANRNAIRASVMILGAVNGSPYAPALASIIIIAAVVLLAAAVCAAASIPLAVTLTFLVIGLMLAALIFVPVLRSWQWRRTVADTVPGEARGLQGREHFYIAKKNRELKATIRDRDRREITTAGRISAIARWVVLLDIVVLILTRVFAPGLPWLVAALVLMVCAVIFLATWVADLIDLRRTIKRVRGRTASARDHSVALDAATRRTDAVDAVTRYWATIAIIVLGFLAYGPWQALAWMPAAAIIGLIGLAVLALVRTRVDAASQMLREEFGYRLPHAYPSGNTNASVL